MPSGRNGDPVCGTGGACYTNWTFDIYPYVKSRGAFTCPDDSSVPGNGAVGNGVGTPVPVSYVFNLSALQTLDDGSVSKLYPATLSLYNAPSLTVWLCEAFGTFNDPSMYVNAGSNEPGDILYGSNTTGSAGDKLDTGPFAQGVATGNRSGSLSTKFATGVHTDASNFLMADGHVKWLKATKVSTGLESNCSDRGFDMQDQSSPVNCVWGGLASGTFQAAGTGNMTDSLGDVFTATMSKY